jgi:hypothetical protein
MCFRYPSFKQIYFLFAREKCSVAIPGSGAFYPLDPDPDDYFQDPGSGIIVVRLSSYSLSKICPHTV